MCFNVSVIQDSNMMIFNQHIDEIIDEIMLKNMTGLSFFDTKEAVFSSCLERLNS